MGVIGSIEDHILALRVYQGIVLLPQQLFELPRRRRCDLYNRRRGFYVDLSDHLSRYRVMDDSLERNQVCNHRPCYLSLQLRLRRRSIESCHHAHDQIADLSDGEALPVCTMWVLLRYPDPINDSLDLAMCKACSQNGADLIGSKACQQETLDILGSDIWKLPRQLLQVQFLLRIERHRKGDDKLGIGRRWG